MPPPELLASGQLPIERLVQPFQVFARHKLAGAMLLMAAAVADFRPKASAESKLKKRDGIPQVALDATPDILEAVTKRRSGTKHLTVLIGFAAETENRAVLTRGFGQYAEQAAASLDAAALMMQLGADGVFVGSGIFKSGEPAKRANAIVQAVTHYDNPEILAEVSRSLGEAMVGIHVTDIPEAQRLAERGW